MKENKDITLVEVFSGKIWEAEMLKNILENEEIEAFLKDEVIGTLAPWYASSGGMGSVKVIVSSLDYDKAKHIVDEFEKNSK